MPLSDFGFWNPGISIAAGALQQLPHPIKSLQINDKWDFKQMKIPLKDGISLAGHSYSGVRITASGDLAKDKAGTTVLTEILTFDAWSDFRSQMNRDSGDTPYEFFIYHDAGEPIYRKFKNVWPVNSSLGLGDDNNVVFVWSAEWVAEDTVVYTTAPGA